MRRIDGKPGFVQVFDKRLEFQWRTAQAVQCQHRIIAPWQKLSTINFIHHCGRFLESIRYGQGSTRGLSQFSGHLAIVASYTLRFTYPHFSNMHKESEYIYSGVLKGPLARNLRIMTEAGCAPLDVKLLLKSRWRRGAKE